MKLLYRKDEKEVESSAGGKFSQHVVAFTIDAHETNLHSRRCCFASFLSLLYHPHLIPRFESLGNLGFTDDKARNEIFFLLPSR